ncbi:MAG: CapA family protein [Bacteroidales bacterium]|nr:CapA family protein [Bacteroidales bacterium]
MIRLSVFGDFGFTNRLPALVTRNESNNILSGVRHLYKDSDVNIVNLEAPLVVRECGKIKKEGPHLKCGSEALMFLKSENFNVLTLANNHIRDYGSIAVDDTINIANQMGFYTVGAGHNKEEASKALTLCIKNEKVTIINACETEFSIVSENQSGANPINEIDIYYQIVEAKKRDEYVVVIIHGGHEYYQLPSPRMKKMFRFFVDAGADAVIGHHPHCYSGFEVYKENPIFYSLGNFCFDSGDNNRLWNEGFFVVLKIEHEKIDFEIHPYNQCAEEPIVRQLGIEEQEVFNERINELNKIIQDDLLLNDRFSEWTDKNRRKSMSRLLPYSNHYLVALYKRGLFPSLLSKKKLINISNAIRCEAHRDIVQKILDYKLR